MALCAYKVFYGCPVCEIFYIQEVFCIGIGVRVCLYIGINALLQLCQFIDL